MKLTALLTAALVAAQTITACGKKSDDKKTDSVDSDGNCTQAFVTDYNNVKFAADNASSAVGAQSSYYTEAEKTARIRTLKNACDAFYAKHGSTTCFAKVDFQKATIPAPWFGQVCNAATAALNTTPKTAPDAKKSPAPETTKPADTSALLSTFIKSELKAKVTDAYNMTRALNESGLYMVNGRVGKIDEFTSALRAGAAICFFVLEETSPTNGLTLTLTKNGEETTEQGYRHLTLTFAGQNNESVGVGCMKLENKPFTLNEILNATQGTLELSSTK